MAHGLPCARAHMRCKEVPAQTVNSKVKEMNRWFIEKWAVASVLPAALRSRRGAPRSVRDFVSLARSASPALPLFSSFLGQIERERSRKRLLAIILSIAKLDDLPEKGGQQQKQ